MIDSKLYHIKIIIIIVGIQFENYSEFINQINSFSTCRLLIQMLSLKILPFLYSKLLINSKFLLAPIDVRIIVNHNKTMESYFNNLLFDRINERF